MSEEPKAWEATDERPMHAGKEMGGSGTFPGYTVEARVSGPPVELAGQMFDSKWRSVSFDRNSPGIPISVGPGSPTDALYRRGLGW